VACGIVDWALSLSKLPFSAGKIEQIKFVVTVFP
jgi:hypothetical protein